METAVNYPLAVIAKPTPLSSLPCAACPLVRETLDLRARAGYWESAFVRAREREQVLQQEVEQLKAEIRVLEQRLTGHKAETRPGADQRPGTDCSGEGKGKPKRPRGQQPGNHGPQRRDHQHLPVIDEVVDLPEDQRLCPCCGKPLAAMEQTDDGEILEIDVRAYRRRYRRRRYRPTCTCGVHPPVVSPPPPPKVIPKGILGVSIWVDVLLRKFDCFQPLYRVLRELRGHGLDLSSATIIDGLRKLRPLFLPL